MTEINSWPVGNLHKKFDYLLFITVLKAFMFGVSKFVSFTLAMIWTVNWKFVIQAIRQVNYQSNNLWPEWRATNSLFKLWLEYRTIGRANYFWSFEYWTSLLFRSPLYFINDPICKVIKLFQSNKPFPTAPYWPLKISG